MATSQITKTYLNTKGNKTLVSELHPASRISAFQRLWSYVTAPSNIMSLVVGTAMYASYGYVHNAFCNPYLIAISIFIAFCLPYYSKLSNRAEELIQLKTANVTAGRVGRYIPQLLFNFSVFSLFSYGGVLTGSQIASLGGTFAFSALTTAASQGMQYLCIALSNREIGEKNRNVIIGLSFNVIVTCLATLGIPLGRQIFLLCSTVFGAFGFGIGILSDLRGYMAPRGGIGIFFGTFNPLHKTHIKMIRELIEQRGLKKVYLHPTVVPKLHRDALRRREIVIAHREAGMRVYQKTTKADPHLNYFPTGNKFFEYETRCLLIRLAIAREFPEGQVELLSDPETYKKEGFYGIISSIKLRHPNDRIHGLHGSDLGGMWVRSIFDESGWIYPYAVRRTDQVSATAVRKGTRDLTPPIIESILCLLRKNQPSFSVENLRFTVSDGVLSYE